METLKIINYVGAWLACAACATKMSYDDAKKNLDIISILTNNSASSSTIEEILTEKNKPTLDIYKSEGSYNSINLDEVEEKLKEQVQYLLDSKKVREYFNISDVVIKSTKNHKMPSIEKWDKIGFGIGTLMVLITGIRQNMVEGIYSGIHAATAIKAGSMIGKYLAIKKYCEN